MTLVVRFCNYGSMSVPPFSYGRHFTRVALRLLGGAHQRRRLRLAAQRRAQQLLRSRVPERSLLAGRWLRCAGPPLQPPAAAPRCWLCAQRPRCRRPHPADPFVRAPPAQPAAPRSRGAPPCAPRATERPPRRARCSRGRLRWRFRCDSQPDPLAAVCAAHRPAPRRRLPPPRCTRSRATRCPYRRGPSTWRPVRGASRVCEVAPCALTLSPARQWLSGWLRWTWCGATATPAAGRSGRG